MTAFKGLPGPWTAQDGFLTIYTCSQGEHGLTIALAKVLRDQLVKDYGPESGCALAEAHARAFAAVPQMIRALEWQQAVDEADKFGIFASDETREKMLAAGRAALDAATKEE